MKIIRLKGGLGNQLFILAAALYVRHTDRILVDARPTYRTDRKPNLDLIKFLNITYYHSGIISLVFRILDKLKLTNKIPFYIDDYFQTPDTLVNLSYANKMRFAAFLNLLPLQPVEMCAIHIRLGDFINQMPHEILPPEYYLDELVKVPLGLEVVIISDADKDELIKQGFSSLLQRQDVRLSSKTSMNEQFYELAAASHVIGSNSTFCLWATFLGNSLEKKKHVSLGPTFKIYESLFND